MVKYLQVDGVDDYLKTPSITFNEIIMDILVIPKASGDQYYLDARTGIANSFMFYRASTAKDLTSASSPWASTGGGGQMFVDGVQRTDVNNINVPKNQRTTVRLAWTTPGTDDVNFFTNNSNSLSNVMNANVYRITFKNAGVIVADYDMTTGTVQDQSGNSNHATLNGGTWLDDGTGGGTTDITVTSVISTSNADAIAPAVTTEQQISVSSVIAGTTADATNPALSTDTNLLGIIGTSTADALSSNVGTFTNITVNAVIVDASADGISPIVSADRNISLMAPFADVNADAFVPMVGLSSSVQITATVTSVMADGNVPSIATTQGTRIDSVVAQLTIDGISPSISTDAILNAIIADLSAVAMAPSFNVKIIIGTIRLKGSRELNVYLKGDKALNVNLKGLIQ